MADTVITVADVLAAEEYVSLPFADTTVLVSRRTPAPLGDVFARCGVEEKRLYVRAAAALATAAGADLADALVVLLARAYAFPSTLRNRGS